MGEDMPPEGRLTRRSLLAAGAGLLGAAALAPWRRWLKPGRQPVEGRIVDGACGFAHRLRDRPFPAPEGPAQRTTVAILGAGVAGLSAAWKLERSGLKDFRILELADEPGGNSRWGASEASEYPWAAHYLPFPPPEARAVHELLRELKVQTGVDGRGRPVYDERYVCFAPTERLYIHGRWQEGVFPHLGASAEDLAQQHAFEAEMSRLRRLRGSDGRRAFALPMEYSSRDPRLLAYDSMSMAEFLERRGWRSERLRWYVEYGCRDDFGTLLQETSAWAAVHYHAARGEGDEDQVLTWPEGNGWLVKRLAAVAGARLRPRSLAFRVAPREDGVRIDYLDGATGKARGLEAKAVLACVPAFSAARILQPWRSRPPAWVSSFQYTPWVVANVTLDDPPEPRGGARAWDNIFYAGASLGYVVATHQSLTRHVPLTVWTYYLPLTGKPPAEARADAGAADWAAWKARVLADLSRAHKDIERYVRSIDVMVWGHAMVKPKVGFIWGSDRAAAARPLGGRIFFGHSDLSGFSLFEEAQYRGVRAAQDAMTALGKPFAPSV